MMMTPVLPVLALVLSSASILLLRRPATAWGLADVPGGRKQHQGIVPLTGGLGVFIGFLLVQPLQPVPVGELLPLYVGLVLLVACGVIDDARDMRSTVKLGVQLLVAALMVLWGQRVLHHLGTFPGVGEVSLGWLAVPVSIVAVAGLINAINMMDGVDGLAGGSTLGVLGWLAFVASVQSQLSLLAVIVTLAAAVTGFLLFNLRHPWRSKASVFMGDAGSMALGFAIAWFVVELSQSERALVSPVAYGWLLALPVMDTLSLMCRRIRKGRSPLAADRDHLHHIFLRAGFTPGQTTLVLMLCVIGLGGVGVLFSLVGVPDILLLVGLAVVVVAHSLFVGRAWRTSKALRRLHAATLGSRLHQPAVPMVRLRKSARVGGWRRALALAGLYLMAGSLALEVRLTLAGAVLSVAAGMAAYPAFWRDAVRLPLFWVSLALSAFIALRLLAAGGLGANDANGWVLLAITGLASLPIAWWLAQFRLHWPWLVLTLLVGGGVAFMLHVDWPSLTPHAVRDPWVWGAPAQTGFLASVGLMAAFSLLFSGLQRLGTGWRPAYQVALGLLFAVPGMVILMATGYTTAWLAALAGLATFAVATPLLGRHQGYRLGRTGVGLVVGVLVVGVLSHQLLLRGGQSLVELLVQPLQALGLLLNDQPRLAQLLHPGMVERVTLWQQALQGWQGQWLLGTGRLVPADGELVAGYRAYHSQLASVAAGLGLVGLVGFAAAVAIPFYAIVWMAWRHAWHSAWALGLLSSGVAVMVMSLLSVPTRFPGPLAFMVLLTAAAQVAVFQRAALRQRGMAGVRHVGSSKVEAPT
ncbi:undecaprenyl/decaprenyl-phosphate alpha-N-acetylglucosaminyl 1-phosphate transferase [Halomonas urmiana]|uniref:Undecaprenyl/decaprenyl-phosphate alpha-N-acetylglucosaminyl 1-phosphate transferase n=1 Tax=Halomonas urmiana TaxID=490901 RepID=A0A5R8M7N8_9GAMM|nr:MraY family glycosyltransferase [Halomonas urmiana]TLF44789.1 undecaprenyl/decaprenyl-phosphate alpha-N-acetylglucosaminyl 1-phosphate transferase [Halomonas urmiana]